MAVKRYLVILTAGLHEQGEKGLAIEQIVPFVKNQTAMEGKATAYVCENYICNQPVNNIEDFEKMISGTKRKKD